MKPRVKICGITNLEDALNCAHAGADALGFIFYKKSPRYIEPKEAATIIQHLPLFITPVGVFVNESRNRIEEISKQTHIRIIQMSGDESPADCTGFSVKVWKSFRIKNLHEVEAVKEYTIAAAMLDGAGNGIYGGSGVLADFSIALAMKKFHPVILAGGLNPDNVLDAIQAVQPYAVDINSGVESIPGKKDHAKVALLFKALNHIS
jgi:phosphoribosylanthranilate isomerase